jgi:uncharacterized protein (TIGR00297 family)
MPDPGTITLGRCLLALVVNLAVALPAYRKGSVDGSGLLSGLLYGFVIFVLLGWQGFLVLFTFFLVGTLCSKHQYQAKARLGVAQEKGGARSWQHATANAGLGFLLAVAYGLAPHPLILLAFVGAFATALADTVSSELGQVYGRHPILITSLQPVPVGTEGAVSLEGTLLGIVASVLMGLLGLITGLVGGLAGVLAVVLGAFVGTTAESVLGATLEGRPGINNETINFLNTLLGATATVLCALLLGW